MLFFCACVFIVCYDVDHEAVQTRHKIRVELPSKENENGNHEKRENEKIIQRSHTDERNRGRRKRERRRLKRGIRSNGTGMSDQKGRRKRKSKLRWEKYHCSLSRKKERKDAAERGRETASEMSPELIPFFDTQQSAPVVRTRSQKSDKKRFGCLLVLLTADSLSDDFCLTD